MTGGESSLTSYFRRVSIGEKILAYRIDSTFTMGWQTTESEWRALSWLETGEATLNTPRSPDALAEACAALAKATNTSRICVTRAAEGAALWENGNLLCAQAPQVTVKDTVGAGDSFMAGLTVGLTRGIDTQKVLENACRVGAFVASHNGATPLLPPEITQEFKRV